MEEECFDCYKQKGQNILLHNGPLIITFNKLMFIRSCRLFSVGISYYQCTNDGRHFRRVCTTQRRTQILFALLDEFRKGMTSVCKPILQGFRKPVLNHSKYFDPWSLFSAIVNILNNSQYLKHVHYFDPQSLYWTVVTNLNHGHYFEPQSLF